MEIIIYIMWSEWSKSMLLIKNITDDYRHDVLEGERYIKGRYLEIVTERSTYVKYHEVSGVVFIQAQEVNSTYIKIIPVTLIMTKESMQV